MVELLRLRFPICLLGVVAAIWAIAGCDSSSGEEVTTAGSPDSSVLSAKETKRLLRQLPYRYAFRPVTKPEGADAAVAGRAVGRYRTVLNFGIALGHGHHAVSVPRAGTIYSYGFPRGGFIFTSDEFIKGKGGRRIERNPALRTAKQWNEVAKMSVNMTDKICLAATGEHCPP